ncbi:nucleoid-associated protein [Roseibacillus ishigakijimensis]|uniref:Nucleoid-associated protein n=1 Tax=Roseibacillus ishigakijimensis TaxID=454146 RepID=A0A934RNQ7_9BACT|nr:nucleoid-associated protein [Roseibacillus ishigakijimensis]MBK1832693.1 hypothetical protein [Roseibacillus ishigakijimensis]
MTIKLDFANAAIAGLVLAKVGNPSRDEPLQTSKQLFEVEEDDQPTLTNIFLRPFRSFSLIGQKFHHHNSLEDHEINNCAAAIFEDPQTLLDKGCQIATRLHSKSTHPNIKSGDLCISHITGVQVGEETVDALCILKSESVTPFLSISARDGDLQLSTEHGINPEKIDKGCLIVNHFSRKGFYVLTFDRGSSESRFWVKDFLGVIAIPDNALLSKKVAEMAVSAVAESSAATPRDEQSEDDTPPWEVNAAAKEALAYFDNKNHFSMAEFEEQALRTPEAKAAFKEKRKQLEEESGVTFDDGFDISVKDASKAKKLMKSVMKLDTGVEIRLKPKVVAEPGKVLEKGYDEERKMSYIKVYFHKEQS